MILDATIPDGWTAFATLIGGICSGFFGMVTACFTAYLGYQMYRIKEGQTVAAVHVGEVKVAAENAEKAAESARQAAADHAETVKITLADTNAVTDEKLAGLAAVADATHTLVNNAMSQQLKITAIALRRVADLTKSNDDATAADAAEKASGVHEAKQHAVDRKDAKDAKDAKEEGQP